MKNFIVKINTRSRENCTIEVPFCFIPIFQSVAEIQGLKDYEWDRGPVTYIFSWKCVLSIFPGIASVACLEFRVGQWDEVRARGPSKRQGRK